MATYRPPSLTGGPRRALPVRRPRAADGRPLPPLETRRPSASSRGYGTRWQKCRRRVLGANPLCASCQKKGLLVAASLVDHIEPVASAADPLFYALSNLQPLCRCCHAQKTWADTRAGKNRQAVRPAAARAPRGQSSAPPPPAINIFYA